MVDSKKLSGSEGGYKNKYVEYRRQVSETKGFDSQLSQATGKTATENAPKAGTPPPPETTSLVTQQASIQSDSLPNAQLSPKMLEYMPVIKQAAAKNNLPAELVAGVIYQESRGNPNAVSHCGARGLMQLMPGTAEKLGVKNSFDPVENIHGGAKYIRQMLDRFGGKLEFAVAAYNAGPGNVSKHNGIPPFRETQDYVPKVLGYAANFKASGMFVDSTTTMRA